MSASWSERRDFGAAVGHEAVDGAIRSRRSIRGFLPAPVPEATVRELLALAACAPSGSNIQPWRAHVLTGEPLRRLTDDLLAQHDAGEPEAREYEYYPTQWRSPYIERRRAVGWKLFQATGVARGDREASHRQRGKNYLFFGAPVGFVFVIDNDLHEGSWLDYGMFLQTLMIAARGRGLDTCPQAAIANYPAILRRHLPIRDSETIICGMALGYADPAEPANAVEPDRELVEDFVTFHGG
jgi:nitroreductase